jgi:hypothetical protein
MAVSVVHGGRERVGLGAEQDQVVQLRMRRELGGEQEPGRDFEGEAGLRDLQADAAELFCAAFADEEGDVAAGVGEASAEVATHGSGSDDENAHETECRG